MGESNAVNTTDWQILGERERHTHTHRDSERNRPMNGWKQCCPYHTPMGESNAVNTTYCHILERQSNKWTNKWVKVLSIPDCQVLGEREMKLWPGEGSDFLTVRTNWTIQASSKKEAAHASLYCCFLSPVCLLSLLSFCCCYCCCFLSPVCLLSLLFFYCCYCCFLSPVCCHCCHFVVVIVVVFFHLSVVIAVILLLLLLLFSFTCLSVVIAVILLLFSFTCLLSLLSFCCCYCCCFGAALFLKINDITKKNKR